MSIFNTDGHLGSCCILTNAKGAMHAQVVADSCFELCGVHRDEQKFALCDHECLGLCSSRAVFIEKEEKKA